MLELARKRLVGLVGTGGCPDQVREAASSVLASMDADEQPSLTDSWVVLLYALAGDRMIQEAQRCPAPRRPSPVPPPAPPPAPKPPPTGRPRASSVRDPTGLGLGRGHFESRDDGRRVFVED